MGNKKGKTLQLCLKCIVKNAHPCAFTEFNFI